MCVLPGQTQSSVAAVLVFVLTIFAQGAAYAAEDAGHSPFGILQREGFAAVTRSGTAEYEALFARPVETTTEALDAAAKPSTLPDDVVFAGSALPAGQEVVAGPVTTPLLPLLISSPGTAEYEALFARPVETTTEALDAAAQPSTLPDDVVFAGSALPAGQEVVAGPVTTPFLPLLISSPVDAVVFGPPLAGAGLDPMPDRYPGTPLTHQPTSGSTPLPAPTLEAAVRLKARARELLATGAVAQARAFLEGAVARGDAEGEYLLAQTYDPAALSRTGVIGIAGDAGKASALYRAAQLGGYTGPDNNVRAAPP